MWAQVQINVSARKTFSPFWSAKIFQQYDFQGKFFQNIYLRILWTWKKVFYSLGNFSDALWISLKFFKTIWNYFQTWNGIQSDPEYRIQSWAYLSLFILEKKMKGMFVNTECLQIVIPSFSIKILPRTTGLSTELQGLKFTLLGLMAQPCSRKENSQEINRSCFLTTAWIHPQNCVEN